MVETKKTISFNPPDHLLSKSWIDFEKEIAQNLLNNLINELKKLKLRITKERVHKSRVALRRWFSVWALLSEDGFEEKMFRKKYIKPLRELLKELGKIRDSDVNIETSQRITCKKNFIEDLKKFRKQHKQSIESMLKNLEPEKMHNKINLYLEEKSESLSKSHSRNEEKIGNAYHHFEAYLAKHEKKVQELQELCHRSTSPESLHKLRLAIKKWRYLLTEYLSLTNLELVRMQSVLGEIHDLDRLESKLINTNTKDKSLRKLRKARGILISEFEILKHRLPFGLRPGITSFNLNVKKHKSP